MRSILPFFFGLILLSSCDQDVESIPKGEAQAMQEALRATIAEGVGSIESLESELEKLSSDKSALVSANDHLIVVITSRIQELQSESMSANEKLSEIQEGIEKIQKIEDERRLKGERCEDVVIPFCADGPWLKWPKMIEEANTTIANNDAAEIELRKVLEGLQALPKESGMGEPQR
jgi:hypothetical protein